MDERDYALGEVDRRLGNLLRFGTVSEVDTANALVKINLGDLVTGWVPWTTSQAGQNRVWSVPDVGEQVALLSPGDPSQGVVIGSMFQTNHPANGNAGKDWRVTFKDGTVLEFDRDASILNATMSAAGHFNVTISGAKIEASASSIKLTVGGSVFEITSGGVAITSGSLTHNGTNIGSTHTHTSVQPGSGTSGPPA